MAAAVWLGLRGACPSRSFDGDDFDDVEEDEGLEDLENAEEVGAPRAAAPACPAGLSRYLRPARWPGWVVAEAEEASALSRYRGASDTGAAERQGWSALPRRDRRMWRSSPRESGSRPTRSGSLPPT